jgi:hypothetical protein
MLLVSILTFPSVVSLWFRTVGILMCLDSAIVSCTGSLRTSHDDVSRPVVYDVLVGLMRLGLVLDGQ